MPDEPQNKRIYFFANIEPICFRDINNIFLEHFQLFRHAPEPIK